MDKHLEPEQCVAIFGRRQKAWLWVAIPAGVTLGASSITMAMNMNATGGVGALQMLGVTMLGLFAVASVVLCRCPQCSKFLYDKKELIPGWALKECPHCHASLKAGRKR
jgi:hypothetical protein